MKQWSRVQVMKGLMDLVTDINYLGDTGNVNGKSGGIQLGTEDAYFFKGIPPFNHNLDYGDMLLSDNGDTDPNHKGMRVKEMYVYGIHKEHDPGTLFFWKCDEDSDDEIIGNLEDYQIYRDTHEIDGIELEIIEKLRQKSEGEK
jgi:hypothetical protein